MRIGASRLYDTASPYYNAFYGAYVVRLPDGQPYGIEDGSIDPAAVRMAAAYDYSHLVLGDFGLPYDSFVCETSNEEQTPGFSLAGSDGWIRLTADLYVSGAYHEKKGFVRSYLQYGAPKGGSEEEEFAPVAMKSLVYARYFPEYRFTVFFYAMTRDGQTLTECEKEILLKSRIE